MVTTSGVDFKAAPLPGGMSNLRAAAGITMTSIGVGILSIPAAMANAGWVCGIIMLVLSCVLCYYATILLWKALFLNPDSSSSPNRPIATFEDLGRAAFGQPGVILNSVTVHTFLIGVCAVILVILGDSMHLLTSILDKRVWIVICAAVSLPFAWLKTVKEIGFMATIGVAAVALTVIVVVAACIDYYVENEGDAEYVVVGQSVTAVGGAFCTFLFSFAIGGTIPTVVSGMEKPAEFPKVVFAAFAFITTVYILVAVTGYLAYGEALANFDSIVDAISPSDQPLTLYGWILNVVLVILVVTHFLVLFTPTAQLCDALLQLHNENRWSSPRMAEVARIVTRTALVTLCTLIAVLVPSVDKLVNILSAISVVLIVMVYPVVYYWRLQQLSGSTQSRAHFGVQLFVVAVGAVAMVLGTYQAVDAFF